MNKPLLLVLAATALLSCAPQKTTSTPEPTPQVNGAAAPDNSAPPQTTPTDASTGSGTNQTAARLPVPAADTPVNPAARPVSGESPVTDAPAAPPPAGQPDALPQAPVPPAPEPPPVSPSLEALFRQLEERTRDAEADAADVTAAKKALIGAYFSTGRRDYLEKAYAVLQSLEAGGEADRQWLRLQRAMYESLIGEAKRAADELRDALKSEIARSPIEVVEVYHAENRREKDGFYTRRSREGRENSVYFPNERPRVGFKVRYLGAVILPGDNGFRYHLKIEAELFDEEGQSIKLFKVKPVDQPFTSKRSPEDLEAGSWELPKLDAELKANQDYTLRLTFTDMGKPERPAVTKQLYVKLRNK